jgi:hypothetical protein
MTTKLYLIFYLLLLSVFGAAQKMDTIIIDASKVDTKVLLPGTHTWLVYFKMGKDSSRKMYQLWSRKVDFIQYNNKDAIGITQVWEDNDTIIHTVNSVCDRKTFAPLLHESWWRGRGNSKVNYIDKTVFVNGRKVTGADTAATLKKTFDAFSQAISQNTFNWHLDLETFSILPYAKGKSFLINFYDPGIPFPPQKEIYTVAGDAKLKMSNGDEIDCWLLQKGEEGKNFETFWINKKTKEVMKLEQQFGKRYRYKIKMGFSQ